MAAMGLNKETYGIADPYHIRCQTCSATGSRCSLGPVSVLPERKNEMGATCVMYTQHALFSRLGFHAKLGLNKISPTLQSKAVFCEVWFCLLLLFVVFVCVFKVWFFVCLLFLVLVFLFKVWLCLFAVGVFNFLFCLKYDCVCLLLFLVFCVV